MLPCTQHACPVGVLTGLPSWCVCVGGGVGHISACRGGAATCDDVTEPPRSCSHRAAATCADVTDSSPPGHVHTGQQPVTKMCHHLGDLPPGTPLTNDVWRAGNLTRMPAEPREVTYRWDRRFPSMKSAKSRNRWKLDWLEMSGLGVPVPWSPRSGATAVSQFFRDHDVHRRDDRRRFLPQHCRASSDDRYSFVVHRINPDATHVISSLRLPASRSTTTTSRARASSASTSPAATRRGRATTSAPTASAAATTSGTPPTVRADARA